ncbi:tetraacyldisaccharide 4'-kinase [Pseudorhodoplanes sinuspersici]|uniref:Tetraacyldisaccharide 4'-kinase n=1 Tax=Pseudorhodoplanes sinuspersici TaxID=1235591 RepID=A0A1W6ZRR1_9HYPH|nr:tetraacyldisaccharide 4'-kinase [Pseudorhodoplanes sinuspersici]ARP99965.1 tetraacyldisaccharide 4'-kinase [Pseudorhodoplanes sinuspersici]RKE70992.1 lipid-A-disaccharide kinase [Pseudorhodoplanes sinuspersici]
MRDPGFWWHKPGIAAYLLWPISAIYGAITASRMRRQGLRADIPVICVGNFTLGGTGKTPTAIAIAKFLAAEGEKPLFLTRGYGGRLHGPIRVDPSQHKAEDVGDEPLLLARQAPVIVSRDRAAGAVLATSLGASVIVMDDGLQNPSLMKNVSIAVADARRGFGNAFVFPAGPLRAPLARQFKYVQAVLMIGQGAGVGQITDAARTNGIPVLRAWLEPSPEALKSLNHRKTYAFAGIGDPEKFFITLVSAGVEAQVEERFPDHHPYSEEDAERILARCKREKLIPVTTEKDLARLAGASGQRGRLAAAAEAIPVSLILEESEDLRKLLRNALAARARH